MWTRTETLPHFRFKEDKREPEMVQISKITGLGAVNKPKGSLLFVSGEIIDGDTNSTRVAVWGFEHGLVGLKYNQAGKGAGVLEYSEERSLAAMQKEPERGDLEPLCVYHQPGTRLDVDQAGPSTTFAVQLMEDGETVNMWDLEAVEPGKLVIEPEGPASLLMCPGYDELLLQMNHKGKVYDMRVVEDQDGPALVSACDDGTAYIWDLKGYDAGQCYGEMRSMAPLEIILPVVTLFITVAQVFSFAFGPSVPLPHKVNANAVVFHNLAMLDFKKDIKIPKEMVFWPEMTIILSAIMIFQFFAITDMPHRMDALVRMSMEVKSDFLKAIKPLLVSVAWAMRSVVYIVMQLLSTVLVVPMLQSCAQAVDCKWADGKHWIDIILRKTTLADVHLEDVDTVQCYTGRHLHLVLLMIAVVPTYIVFLVPYAVCAGDAQYINWQAVWDFKVWRHDNKWRLAAKRKATDMHLGFLGPTPAQAFMNLSMELMSKILLPCITTLTTHSPLLQMTTVSIIGGILWWMSVAKAPYVERKFCVLVQDLKLLTFCAMVCGMFTVYMNNPESFLTIYILIVCTGAVAISLTIKFCCLEVAKPVVVVYRHGEARLAGTPGTNEKTPLLEESGETPAAADVEAPPAEAVAPNPEAE